MSSDEETVGVDSSLNLTDLPEDVLFIILGFCDTTTLCRLSCVCKLFSEIVGVNQIWNPKTKSVFFVGHYDKEIRRWPGVLPAKEICRIGWNWKVGRYKKKCLKLFHSSPEVSSYVSPFSFAREKRLIPWLQLQAGLLWMSTGSEIQCIHHRKPRKILQSLSGIEDFTRFVVKDGLLVSGGSCGSVFGFDCESGNRLFHLRRAHLSNVHSVDISRDCLVTGSRDGSVKLWSCDDDRKVIADPPLILNVGERVWSLQLNDTFLAVGGAGVLLPHRMPLTIYDLNGGTLPLSPSPSILRRGAGILELQWESPSLIITCGYDSFLRLWDIRTGNCVGEWADPFDSALYCLCSDRKGGVITGTYLHSRVQMWDLRTSKPLKMLYSSPPPGSPVFSVASSSSHLYVALDKSVQMFNFDQL